MKLNIVLDRPLCFFDIESTGLNVVKDKIIQIALIKYSPDQEVPEKVTLLIDPVRAIMPDAVAVHGITNEMLKGKPTFEKVAEQIFQFIGSADLCGYNSNRFDVPMLMEEFNRVGYEFSLENRRLIDAQRIFYKKEPRTLEAALKFYCSEELVNAHDAMADVEATIKVLNGQIEKYPVASFAIENAEAPDSATVKLLADFTNDPSSLDITNRLKYDNKGRVVFNFGKNIGKPVGETLYKDRHYYRWIMDKDFSIQVKMLVSKQLQDYQMKVEKKNNK